MNFEEEVVIGWADLLGEEESIELADTCSKIGGEPVGPADPGLAGGERTRRRCSGVQGVWEGLEVLAAGLRTAGAV